MGMRDAEGEIKRQAIEADRLLDKLADGEGELRGQLAAVIAELTQLRAAVEPLRPYRVPIRAGTFYPGAETLADAILGAVAALDRGEDMGGDTENGDR